MHFAWIINKSSAKPYINKTFV